MREFQLISNNKKLNIITHKIEEPSCILIHIHGLCSNFQNDTYTPNDFLSRSIVFNRRLSKKKTGENRCLIIDRSVSDTLTFHYSSNAFYRNYLVCD